MRYFLWTDGVETGPIEESEFLERCTYGRLPSGTLVRPENVRKFSTPEDVRESIAKRQEYLLLYATLPEVKAAVTPPMNTSGSVTGQDVLEVVGFLMLLAGLLTCGFALLYDTAPGGTHNVGLISNREAGGILGVGIATCGGLIVIAARISRLQESLIKALENREPGKPKGG